MLDLIFWQHLCACLTMIYRSKSCLLLVYIKCLGGNLLAFNFLKNGPSYSFILSESAWLYIGCIVAIQYAAYTVCWQNRIKSASLCCAGLVRPAGQPANIKSKHSIVDTGASQQQGHLLLGRLQPPNAPFGSVPTKQVRGDHVTKIGAMWPPNQA